MNKRYFYLIILFFLLAGVFGGFYFGVHISAEANARKTASAQSQAQAEKAAQPAKAAESFPSPGASEEDRDISSAVQVASSDPVNINAVFGVDISIVDKSLQMLKEECLDEVNQRQLINGAVSGLKKRLKERKLSTDFIAPIPASCPEGELLKELHKIYAGAVSLHGEKISEVDLSYGALIGMMEALNDPYSVALEPREYKLLNEYMTGGNYGGIGIYLKVDPKTHYLTVVQPIAKGPADRAGLKPGDSVIKINGEPTAGMDMEVASQKIRGMKDTKVTLLVAREGEKNREYTMKREIIHEDSVTYSMKPGKIAYIKIELFGEDTGREFSQAYEQLTAEGARALVIDLRNNTGGYISSAIDVCSKILESGSLIVSVVNPRTGRHEVYRAYGGEQTRLPIAVLVNENSASSSEIVAGALKDTDSAFLVGTKTFGKGMVQSIREFRDGGALKYTIAKYMTPRGDDINKKGIVPNVVVNMDVVKINTEGDVQRDKALSLLRQRLNKAPAAGKKKENLPAVDDFRD